ncbi:hypothetical protein PT974_06129 [Cladobotryum mycophilum]|uniref:EKC/KEOPS complex subunit BUD32 n=1 Tax=Cladobotryum mycophilum TaxID=491253 RepID=A0ABR0SKQ2_9HYPO
MEICEKAEISIEKDGDFVFHHFKVIVKQNDEYFFAIINEHIRFDDDIDPTQLNLTRIPTEDIWPDFDPKLTRAPDPLPLNCYVKRPSLLYCDGTKEALEIGAGMLEEVAICETLLEHPHPNIVRYHGCLVEGGKIKGLCLDKLKVTLEDRVQGSEPLDVDKCMQGIEDGVNHMHGLGLIHNDLSPSNIMMDGDDDNSVIIDFDSCKLEGLKLGVKGGSFGYEIENMEYAQRVNDTYSVSKIRELLEREQ